MREKWCSGAKCGCVAANSALECAKNNDNCLWAKRLEKEKACREKTK